MAFAKRKDRVDWDGIESAKRECHERMRTLASELLSVFEKTDEPEKRAERILEILDSTVSTGE